jgi:membrane protease YdiL (CAAX protease family)
MQQCLAHFAPRVKKLRGRSVLNWRATVLAIGKIVVTLAVMLGAMHFFRLQLLPQIQIAVELDDTATSAVRRAGILLVVILAYWVSVRVLERRAVDELRFEPAGIMWGALSGAVLISIVTLSLFAAGIYEVTAVRGLQNGLLGVAGLIVVAAMLEEVAFRGVIFLMLERAWGTLPAMGIQSLLFALQHLDNVEGAGLVASLTTLVSGTLVGAFWTLVIVHTRNLWIVGANHAAWNFAIILTGLPLSGLESWRELAPFESRYNGPDWLTGGAFGPEDSVLTIGLMVVCLAVLYREARKRKRTIEV